MIADDRDLELAGLFDRDVLLVRIDHEHHAGQLVHGLDAAERLQELVAIAADHHLLALGQREQRAVLFHLLETAQALERALHRLEVGERAAQPALRHVVLARTGRLLDDHVLRLLLGADEQDRLATARRVDHGLEGLAEQLDRVLQVDDVDAVTRAEDVLLHLRVPPTRVVSEVHARLEKRAHADGVLPRRFCHRFHCHPPLVASPQRHRVPETLRATAGTLGWGVICEGTIYPTPRRLTRSDLHVEVVANAVIPAACKALREAQPFVRANELATVPHAARVLSVSSPTQLI